MSWATALSAMKNALLGSFSNTRKMGAAPNAPTEEGGSAPADWRRASLPLALLIVLTLAFAGLIVFSLQDSSAKEGGPAPAFSITTDHGKTITQDSFGGKLLVLHFWATWCGGCVQEIPSLNVFQRKFADKGVVVVAISIDKNPQKYKSFLEKIPVSYATARDPKADISTEYGTFQYPETYLIKDGRIVHKYANAENWTNDDITQYVESLL
jgi:peroxiredoxin